MTQQVSRHPGRKYGMSPDVQSFSGRADSAAFWEAWVGAVLARAGLYTTHHPFTVGTEVGLPNSHYAQSWDLDVGFPATSGPTSTRPVEVKSMNQNFTSAKDYPFDDVLVCSQASWLKKWPGQDTTQRDFLFVSRVSGAILWLPTGAMVTLGHETFDSKRGELYKTVKTYKGRLGELSDFVESIRGR